MREVIANNMLHNSKFKTFIKEKKILTLTIISVKLTEKLLLMKIL